jgi:hypothetical protein
VQKSHCLSSAISRFFSNAQQLEAFEGLAINATSFPEYVDPKFGPFFAAEQK